MVPDPSINEGPLLPPVTFKIPVVELGPLGQPLILTELLIVVGSPGHLPGVIGPITICPASIAATRLQISLSYPLLLK